MKDSHNNDIYCNGCGWLADITCNDGVSLCLVCVNLATRANMEAEKVCRNVALAAGADADDAVACFWESRELSDARSLARRLEAAKLDPAKAANGDHNNKADTKPLRPDQLPNAREWEIQKELDDAADAARKSTEWTPEKHAIQNDLDVAEFWAKHDRETPKLYGVYIRTPRSDGAYDEGWLNIPSLGDRNDAQNLADEWNAKRANPLTLYSAQRRQ